MTMKMTMNTLLLDNNVDFDIIDQPSYDHLPYNLQMCVRI